MQPIEYWMIIIGYLAGSIPTGLIVFYLLKRDDIRKHGSKNLGATNVARNAGAVAGIITLIIDTLKGFLPVAACLWVGISPESWAITFVALAAIAGHMFPVWLLFRGGKGAATALGVFLALAWQATLLALPVFVATFLIRKTVSLSTLTTALAFIILVFVLAGWLGWGENIQIGALLGGGLVIVKHYENIFRIIKGQEKKLNVKN